MLQFITNLSGKKIAIVLVILGVLVGCFMVFAFVTVTNSARNSVPNDPGRILREQKKQRDQNPKPTITAGPVETTNDYLNDYYVISYPSNWTVLPEIHPDGDRTMIFKPSRLTDQAMQMSILTDQKSMTIDQRADEFVKKGYIKGEEYYNGKKFTTVVSNPESEGGSMKQHSVLYITAGSITVTVQYQYSGESRNPIIENFFKQVLSTLTVF